jgi:uncharacterized membrane-anchored protein
MKALLTATTLALLLATSLPSFAQDASAVMTDEQKQAIWDSANKAAILGPSDVVLGDQAKLHLPESMQFVPAKESAALMRMWGNGADPSLNGLVFAKSPDDTWTISIRHTAEGYVKDDDAKTWNADELLKSLKDGTEQQNETRIKMGMPALDIVGWVQPPNYSSERHRLVWSLKAVDRGAAADEPSTVNYNTYALGKDGYFEIDLMTTDKTIEIDKSAAYRVVDAVDYNAGKKYSDFKPGTDRIAEYGLAALVAGVAAKKLGFLALAGVFVLKFIKIIGVGVVVAGAAIKKLFFGRQQDNDSA